MPNDARNEDRGVHYHYHYYGTEAAPGDAAAADTTPAQPYGPAAANPHRHPRADALVKGALFGAAITYLATSESAQRTIMRSVVRIWGALRNGAEEIKERLHDAEAEVAAGGGPVPPEVERRLSGS
jgi:hypothetical protein